MSEQQHRSDPRILDRRTLHDDHRSLASILTPGMSVLDVGCGTGAITKGIAEAVGPGGTVTGIDRDQALVEQARAKCHGISNLSFEVADATALRFERRFDVVTAARVLQWIKDAEGALSCMARAVKDGGLIVVLDYNHALNAWEPDPPAAFREFYDAFLSWRHGNGWDNEIGNHLAGLFEQAGLTEISTVNQDEPATRGEVAFAQKTALWTELIDNLAATLIKSGACTATLLADARAAYESWRHSDLVRQTLSLTATLGRVRVTQLQR